MSKRIELGNINKSLPLESEKDNYSPEEVCERLDELNDTTFQLTGELPSSLLTEARQLVKRYKEIIEDNPKYKTTARDRFAHEVGPVVNY